MIDAVELPDPDDRHVLAAAIKARVQVIVTSNFEDFPEAILAPWNIDAKSPDDFVLDQFHLDGAIVHGAVQRVADGWRNPPGSIEAACSACGAPAPAMDVEWPSFDRATARRGSTVRP